MGSKRLPDGYLDFCSLDALESLVLARMNEAANLCVEAKQLLRGWVEAEADVKIALWMLENRRSQQLRTGAIAQLPAAQARLEPLQPEVSRPAARPRNVAAPLATISTTPVRTFESNRWLQSHAIQLMNIGRSAQRPLTKLPGPHHAPDRVWAAKPSLRGTERSRAPIVAAGRRMRAAS